MSRQSVAALFDGPGRLKLSEIQIPEPGPGEVLVQVVACGVCGSDLHQLEGRWEQPPFVPGHEVAGIVAAVGEGVAGVEVGARVCVEPFIYCGRCRYCLSGRYFQCPEMGFLTLTAHGGFCRHMLTPAYSVYRLPDNVSFELGALVEPLAVAVHAARLAAVTAADGVLVLGAGTIGLMCVAAARHLGARRVFVTSRHAHQAEAALLLGAEAALSTETEQLRAQLQRVLPGGPDVVLEAVGSQARALQQAVEVAGKLARIALMGGNTGPMDGINFAPVISKELTLYGSGCYSQFGTSRDFSIALDALAAAPETFERLITHRFDLAQVQEAFAVALDKNHSRALKVVVNP